MARAASGSSRDPIAENMEISTPVAHHPAGSARTDTITTASRTPGRRRRSTGARTASWCRTRKRSRATAARSDPSRRWRKRHVDHGKTHDQCRCQRPFGHKGQSRRTNDENCFDGFEHHPRGERRAVEGGARDQRAEAEREADDADGTFPRDSRRSPPPARARIPLATTPASSPLALVSYDTKPVRRETLRVSRPRSSSGQLFGGDSLGDPPLVVPPFGPPVSFPAI